MTPKSIRIIAVGDLSFNGRYHRLMRRRGPGHPFRFTAPAWREADLRLGNLESPITAARKAFPQKLTLRSAPDAAAALRAAGFDCVTLANNHMMDYGPRGLADTRAALDAAGIAHAGAGADAASAGAPAVVRRNGGTVGVLGFCRVEQDSPLYAGPDRPGVAAFDADAAARSVHGLRPHVDWLVVQVHWGMEMSHLPTPEQRRWAGRLADAGADLIVGHHPHVIQPFETVAGVPVLYSLGNFFFSDMYWRGSAAGGARPFLGKFRQHPLSRRTGWAEVVLKRGRAVVVRFHPARLGRDLAVRPEPTAARRREWERLCSLLSGPDYEDRVREETRLARRRIEWAAAWTPISRRIELKLASYGLIPFAVEGD